MSWLKWVLIVLGLGVVVNSFSKPAPARIRSVKKLPKETDRPHDKARSALASGELDEMIAAVANEKIAIQDRHDLLLGIVEKSYPQRDSQLKKDIFYVHARSYIEKFPEFKPQLITQSPEAAASTPVFKMLAIALTSDGQFDEAIAVCRNALELGVEDGTKTGFEGRIQRIQKMQTK